ncbi:MAG: hypothetical protein C0461_02350 [Brevundimonas sp.]|nr:hypothetical protein [Brevundimonas sp.]
MRVVGAAARTARAPFLQVIDRDRFVQGGSWRDRLAAVSWPRAGALIGVASLAGVAAFVWLGQARPEPHPPALPSDHEVRVGQEAIETFMDGRPSFAARSAEPGPVANADAETDG